MKIIALRFVSLLSLFILQFSFLNNLFPGAVAPVLIIAVVVVWTLLNGFPKVLVLAIPLALMADIATVGAPSVLSLYIVCLSYATSFLSRRLFFEHRGFGIVMYAACVGGGVVGYRVFEALLQHASWQALLLTPPAEALFSVLGGMVLFPILLPLLDRFERYISLISQEQFRGVR